MSRFLISWMVVIFLFVLAGVATSPFIFSSIRQNTWDDKKSTTKVVTRFVYVDKTRSFIQREHEEKTEREKQRRIFEQFIRSKGPKRLTQDNIERIVDVIYEYSTMRNFDPVLVLSIMGAESTYWYRAVSPSKAMGLMQVNPKVWVLSEENRHNLIKIGMIEHVKELFYIGKSVNAGTFILNIKREDCERWKKEHRLNGLGYHSVSQCMIQRYNGANGFDYYHRVMNFIGQYYMFAQEHK